MVLLGLIIGVFNDRLMFFLLKFIVKLEIFIFK